MRIHSFIKVCIAVLTIAFAVSMGTVPVSAQTQPPVSTSNVTQVRITGCVERWFKPELEGLWCWTYDKIAPNRWVQRRNDGKVFQFVESGNNPARGTILLRDDSEQIAVEFSFRIWATNANVKYRGAYYPVSGQINGFYESSADNSPETCTQTTAGVKCNCDLRTLRPLQGAVGMEEVRKKANDITSGKKTRLDLAYDPIKIVRGPNGLLYVTDHHHGARAWIQAEHTMGTCQIQSDTISTDPTQFWTDLKDKKLVRLADKNGNPITETQLPTTLQSMPDDPYRTLAWRVRKGHGFCRALMTGNIEFAEFQWADWLRKRPEFQNPPGPNENWSGDKIIEAIALAKTLAAKEAKLPGWNGDTSSKYKCDPDPDPE